MVKRLAFLPTQSELTLLSNLKGKIETVYCKQGEFHYPYINLGGGHGIGVRAEADGVVFKFDCIYLTLIDYVFNERSFHTMRIISAVEKWHRIVCLFRTEWERLPIPNDVIEYQYEMIMEYSTLACMPRIALNACISLFGVLFVDRENKPILMMSVNDDVPETTLITSNKSDMYREIMNCDQVALENVASWCSALQGWDVVRGGEYSVDCLV